MTYEEALAVATANNEIDENQTFLIDKNLRTVTIPDGFVLGVFNDKNVQIVPFAMPRYYNGIDMSTFAIQVNYVNSAGDGDIYLVFDQDVQEDLILFNWVVDRTAFATSGKTGFVVCMKEDDEYGYVAREFNTTLAYAPVLDGLEIDNPIDEQEVLDVLTQIRRAAERADIAAQNAEDSAAQASTDANTASDAASSATSSAATATAAQQSASASATSATNAETNALAYRDAAAASAAEAAAVVSDIDDVLSFPNALVVESASADNILTIDDGADNVPMKSLAVSMEPIQDLNGQSNPYPPGGGKNLLNNTSSSTTFNGITWTVNSDGTVTANGTATSESIFVVVIGADELPRETNLYFSGCPSGGSASKYNVYILDSTTHARAKKWNNITAVDNDTGASANNELYLTSNHEYQYNMRVMSGQTVSNIVFSPMIRLATESDGTFAPYSNICPISGRTGMTVTRAGKNLFPSKTISMGGTNGRTVSINLPYTLPAGEYIMSYTVGGTSTGGWGMDFFYGSTRVAKLDTITGIVTMSAPVNRIYAYMWQTDYDAGYTRIIDDIQLELGTVVTAYTPYVAPSVYPITWETEAGTVYGGTLDVVSGVLTVDMAMADLGTLNWSYFVRNTRFAVTLNNGKLTGSGNGLNTALCECYPIVTMPYNAMSDKSISVGSNFLGNSRCALVIHDEAYTTENELKTALSGRHIVYELATPQTYQLTPTEVRTLLGVNNLWSDGDSMEVKYRADLKLYIDKKIAEAIA